MQIGCNSISDAGQERCCAGRLCLYCGGSGHFVLSRKREGLHTKGGVHGEPSHIINPFIDSGMDGKFLDEELTRQLGVETKYLPFTLLVWVLGAHILHSA